MSSILVEIENITEEKHLARQVAKTEAEAAQIVTVLEDTDLYREFLGDADDTIRRLIKGITGLPPGVPFGDGVVKLFRDAHTLKGTASAFGAKGLSLLAGRLESVLAVMRTSTDFPEANIRDAEAILDLLGNELIAVRGRAAKVMGDETHENNDIMLRVPLRKLKSIQEAARGIILDGPEETLRRLRMLRAIPVRKGFARAFRIANDLVNRTEKSVMIEINGADELIDCELARELNMPLIHLFRNAFSHGIEKPEERISSGKPERGVVGISAYPRSDRFVIEFFDDGRGLDPERLRTTAVDKRHLTQKEAETLSDQESQKLIFIPGFTTESTITGLSGRGVGMDAVLSAVTHLDGSIEIDSTPMAGVKYTITIPLPEDMRH